MKRTSFLIRLLLTDGIGPVTVLTFARAVEARNAWDECASWDAQTCMTHTGLSRSLAQKIITALQDEQAYESHENWIAAHHVQVMTVFDDVYPRLLGHIAVPPPVLWVKGAMSALQEPMCAVVGARDVTSYAERAVELLVPSLVGHGITTVSGGARGVDRVVHESTMRAGGRTIVVMGSGLAHVYPREHAPLYEKIVASGGALLSPFPPFTAPAKGLFVARNRIIAGLARTCVVVQAAAKSGALITASYALQENREVGVVPGPIDEVAFVGSNKLLNEGAHAVIDAATLLAICGVEQSVAVEQKQLSLELEDPLLRLLIEPRSFDELCELWHADEPSLHERLYELSCGGKIQQNYAGYWERCE